MKISIRAIAVTVCIAMLFTAVPGGVFAAGSAGVASVYLLGGSADEAYLDDTIVIALDSEPSAAAISSAALTVTKNGVRTDDCDYEISAEGKNVYVKFDNLDKGSYYACRITGICGNTVDFDFRTVGFGILAQNGSVSGGRTTAVVKCGYSKPRTVSMVTAFYENNNNGEILKKCYINETEVDSRSGRTVGFDTGFDGSYDSARLFALEDMLSLRPVSMSEEREKIKPLYYENFDSTYTNDGAMKKYVINKNSDFSVKTVDGERCLGLNVTSSDDVYFQYNFNCAKNGYMVCGFDIRLTDDDQVTKLVQFIGSRGADAFVLMIYPDGRVYILNKDFSLGPQLAVFEKNVFNRIDICVDSNRKMMNVYINGEKKTNDYIFDYGSLSAFRIHQWYPNGKKGEVLIDNIAIYEWDDVVADEQIERGIHMDYKKIMKDAVAMYIGKSNVLLHGTKSYISDDRSIVPYETADGKTMIPAKFFAESIGASYSSGTVSKGGVSFGDTENGYADAAQICSAFGKTLHVEPNGIIIYSDENMEDILDWSENLKLMRTISESYQFDDASGDDIYNLLKQKYPSVAGSHPRLLVTKDKFDTMKAEYDKGKGNCDDVLCKICDFLKGFADDYLTKDPCPYEKDSEGIRLTENAKSENASRMITLALMYNLSGEEKYFDKAWEIMDAVADFKDWNPFHFLDVAILASGMGISYDLLYDKMTDAQRAKVRKAIIEKAVNPITDDFDHKTAEIYDTTNPLNRSWNWRGETADNWCLVIATVGTCGALPILDELEGEDLAKAKRVVSQCLVDIRRALSLFAPVGAYEEGPNYWRLAMRFYVFSMRALENSLGTCLGYDDVPGLKMTGEYIRAINGSRGIFNFHDGNNGLPLYSPELYWLADRFDNPDDAAMRNARLKVTYLLSAASSDFAPTDFMYYDTAFNGVTSSPAGLDAYLPISEIASMRSGWSSSDTYVGFHCDDPLSGDSHDQMDAGTFVLDALGQQFFFDLGSDDYNIPNYLQCYRVRAEGHNTVIFNPDSNYAFKYGGSASIVRHSFGDDESYAIGDMTNVYTYDKGVKSFLRGVKLDNDRSRVTVQDKFELTKPAEMYWFAHTDAAIEVSDDGKSAVLTKNGKKLLATIVCGDGATFSVMDAKPLPTSPVIEGQNPNDGIRKLTIHIENCGSNEICVTFVPAANSADSNGFKPLEQW